MGYILLSAISLVAANWFRIVLSYDIACQFTINFEKRMKDFPPTFRLDLLQTLIIFLVPKFHLAAHGTACQIPFAFNFQPQVGRTYGEGIEGNWAETNHTALMTREMPWAARHEALDDFFGGMNWKKTITFGMF